jgi:hypothetical protein
MDLERTHPEDDERAPDDPLEITAESIAETGRQSGDTGGPWDNGPDVDFSDMGDVNIPRPERTPEKPRSPVK